MGLSPQPRGDTFSSEALRPQKSRTINQNNVNFSRTYDTFNVYAQPLTITRKSVTVEASPVTQEKKESIVYRHFTNEWMLGLGEKLNDTTEQSPVEVSRIDYDPIRALPASVWSFGRMINSFTYHPAPSQNIHTVADGRNNALSLEDYARGVPKTIIQPAVLGVEDDTAADVDTMGAVVLVTDELGSKTYYERDELGRLETIIYPTGDTPPWLNTTLTLQRLPVSGAEHGLNRYWKHVVKTGTGEKRTYLDALWRPVLVVEVDTAASTSARYVLRRYDHAGREVFVSHPASTYDAQTDKGTQTTYDALGRVTLNRQYSTVGASPTAQWLETTTEYLDTFKKKVTNARGVPTTYSFQVFDEPVESAPSLIETTGQTYVGSTLTPTTIKTEISRDRYGKPKFIKRSGGAGAQERTLQRNYVYDTRQRLCKTVEPETKATILAYDAADNIAWSVAGSAITGLNDCHNDLPFTDQEKTVFTYDARNRLTTTEYACATPAAGCFQRKIERSYYPDGALFDLKSEGSTWSYQYNRRRLPTFEILDLDYPGYASDSYGIEWHYASTGHRSKLIYPDGDVVEWAPNALGEPTQAIGDDYEYVKAGVTRHANGALATFTYGNNIQHQLTQDGRGLPYRARDVGVLNDVYSHDANGNVTSIVDDEQGGLTSRSMAYDDFDRLVTANAPGLWNLGSFRYDVLDNLTSSTIGSRSLQHQYSLSTNQLQTLTGGPAAVNYVFDSRGNVSSRGSVPYTFDGANRLTVVGTEGGKGQFSKYQYDGWGRRTLIEQASGENRHQFYSRDGQLLFEVDLLSGKTSNFAYMGNRLVARKDISYRTLPVAPVLNPIAPNPSTNGVYGLTWSSVAAITRYEVEESTATGDWGLVYAAPAASWTPPAHANGTFYYRVRACASSDCGAWSNVQSVQVIVGLVPTAPTAPASTTGSFTLQWTVPPNTIGPVFRLEEKTGPNFTDWTLVQAQISSTSYLVNGKSTGTYTYRVAACPPPGQVCGAWSTSGTVTVQLPDPPPPLPEWTLPLITSSTTGTYTLGWTVVSTAVRYEVEESGPSGTSVLHATSNSLQVSGRANGPHFYKVRACKPANNCSVGWREGRRVNVSVAEVPDTPAPPTIHPSANPNTTGTYTVTWSNPGGATSYVLYQRTGSQTVLQYEGPLTSKSYTAQPNASYYYSVVACNVAGCSYPSSETPVHVSRLPDQITWNTVAPNPSTDGNFTLSWSSVQGADSYIILEQIDEAGGYHAIETVQGSSHQFLNKPNGRYQYRIRACENGTCGNTSSGTLIPTATVDVQRPTAPGIPTGLTGPSGTQYPPVTYILSWNAAAGATWYEFRSTPSCGNVDVFTTTATHIDRTYEACGYVGQYETFDYQVRACNAVDCSAWSAMFRVTVYVTGGPVTRPNEMKTVTYLHTDGLGSPVAETNDDRDVLRRTYYEPYGAPTSGVYSNGPGFTGHVMDAATGLSYMQQRYYDSQSGIFLSVDPVSKKDISFSNYWYARNNPYKYIDPDGRWTCSSSAEKCGQFEAGLATIAEAAESPNLSDEEKSIVKGILSAFGEKGDDRVRVSFHENADMRGGATNYHDDGLGGKYNSISLNSLNIPSDTRDSTIIMGGVAIHEGGHARDNFERGRPIGSLSERMSTEINAYTGEAVFYKAMDSVVRPKLWNPKVGIQTGEVMKAAERSVKNACASKPEQPSCN